MIRHTLLSLFDWLRRVFGVADSPTMPPPIESYNDEDRTLKLISSGGDAFPGVVSIWLLESESSRRDVLLLAANLAEIREWIYRVRSQRPGTAEQVFFQRSLEVKARQALREQFPKVSGTHLVIVASIQKDVVQNQRGKFRHLDSVGVWIVDFIGYRTYLNSNTIARRVTKELALKLLKIPNGPRLSWEEVVFDNFPWLEYLEGFTRKILRSDTHNIQPPKGGRHGNG